MARVDRPAAAGHPAFHDPADGRPPVALPHPRIGKAGLREAFGHAARPMAEGEHGAVGPVDDGPSGPGELVPRRELVVLPGGGLLIDTPGMREFGLLEDGDGLDATFADVAEAAAGCRFRDCGHEAEPGCAVREALAAGAITADRWRSYVKLRREAASAEERRDPALAANAKRRWKAVHKAMRSSAKTDPWR